MLTLTHRLSADVAIAVDLTLALTAEERARSRYQLATEAGQSVRLQLPRGTVLHHGDLLQAETGDVLVRIAAKPEPVLTVKAQTSLELLRAAYHLGNRHVALEITTDYLRLSPDPVLQSMLEHLGLQVSAEIAAFQPEVGAYGHSGPSHAH
ncbi:urease accessory protein UreE [Trichocoleus sp. FACHB-591]|uniref:urease accessory protein UreE n=1 Tax=unclassified Trichocoleus TaxID=2628910 RepID=UPI0016870850|nr:MULTISPECIES: urease accessory protein UreE [unclassified Trichocoleus]MBD2097031.1 urease accessory protein UreE [Trichocoleus sp. FACHB-591]MBD2119455.1 urease accessory protein UreE [Trichocoleus sp. FACHB-262]